MPARGRALKGGLAAILAASVGLFGAAAQAGQANETISMAVNSYPIEQFRIGSSTKRFGPLEFIGGMSMTSQQSHFGAFSSFRFSGSGGNFVGVADTGFWFFGRVEHGAGGQPIGFADFRMQPMLDANGGTTREKWMTDAEGIAIRGAKATVSFERVHRIAEYDLAPGNMGTALRNLDFLVPAHELRVNRGFETVAYAPEGGHLAGARVAVSERSIDKKGNVFAAILEGPEKGVFTVARSNGYDITDGAFLPNGDLLLLERRFAMSSGVAMRLRRIDGQTIRAGGVADGPVLVEADMGYQIDNMEALDIWQREDGATMLSLMSDDNHSLLQRNLYLEFRLHDE